MAPRKQYDERRQFTVTLDKVELDAVRRIAAEQRLSISELIRGLVIIFLQEHESKEES